MGADAKYPPPFSLRLTFEERAMLEDQAGNTSLSAYIRERLFDTPTPRKRKIRAPIQDEKLLASILAAFGKSKLSNNMNQLAKASHSGSLLVTDDTEQSLKQACDDIQVIRRSLMQALGLSEGQP